MVGLAKAGTPKANGDFGETGLRIYVHFDPLLANEPKRDWNGLLHFLNIAQGVPDLHVWVPGLEGLPLPEVVRAADIGGAADAEARAWKDLRDMVHEDAHGALDHLERFKGLPAPDVVGLDVMVGDITVGTVEFAWSRSRIAVALEPVVHPEWRVLTVAEVMVDPEGTLGILTSKGVVV